MLWAGVVLALHSASLLCLVTFYRMHVITTFLPVLILIGVRMGEMVKIYKCCGNG